MTPARYPLLVAFLARSRALAPGSRGGRSSADAPRGTPRATPRRRRLAAAGLAGAALLAPLLATTPSLADPGADGPRAGASTGGAARAGAARPAARAAARAAALDDDPLRVRLLSLTPSTLTSPAPPPRGRGRAGALVDSELIASPGARPTPSPPGAIGGDGEIRVTGTVTNRTDDTWSTLNLYPVIGDDLAPMRTPGAVAEAVASEPDLYVGERITDIAEPGRIDVLGPGETAPFTLRLPLDRVQLDAGGVYWFSVQVIATGPDGSRDTTRAAGRARTLLPYVPRRVTTPARAALVVPLVRAVATDADGRVALPEQWVRTMSEGGRLSEILDFVREGGAPPVTWVVDPALVDAVARLADGNPPRAVAAPLPEPTDDPDDTDDTGSPDGSAGATSPGAGTQAPAPTDDAAPLPDVDDDPDAAVAATAAGWLDRLAQLLGDRRSDVLTLPYGNLDVGAALRLDPTLLTAALTQRSTTLDSLDLGTRALITGAGGYLTSGMITAAPADAVLAATEDMVRTGRDGAVPPLADIDGRAVVMTSAALSQGGPGPGPSQSAVALRQRLLAEVAVRALRADQEPVVTVLPTEWGLDDPAGFFDGLRVPWLDLTTIDGAESDRTPVPLTSADLTIPTEQVRRELDAALITEAQATLQSGRTLQNLVVGNTEVAGEVEREVLAALSVGSRGPADQAAARARLQATQDWIGERLQGVEVSVTDGITLSGASGDFIVRLRNTLDTTVAVGLRAVTDGDLRITRPAPVQLAPGQRTTVLLRARTSTNRVHTVTLEVTDVEGTPLGGSDVVRIRSAQVSDVIWIILGSGLVILFGAIGVRLVRRLRGEEPLTRRAAQEAEAAEAARAAREGARSDAGGPGSA